MRDFECRELTRETDERPAQAKQKEPPEELNGKDAIRGAGEVDAADYESDEQANRPRDAAASGLVPVERVFAADLIAPRQIRDVKGNPIPCDQAVNTAIPRQDIEVLNGSDDGQR